MQCELQHCNQLYSQTFNDIFLLVKGPLNSLRLFLIQFYNVVFFLKKIYILADFHLTSGTGMNFNYCNKRDFLETKKKEILKG